MCACVCMCVGVSVCVCVCLCVYLPGGLTDGQTDRQMDGWVER